MDDFIERGRKKDSEEIPFAKCLLLHLNPALLKHSHGSRSVTRDSYIVSQPAP